MNWLTTIIIVFILDYSGYYWNPCSTNSQGWSACLSISCNDIRGCYSEGKRILCTDASCVEETLEKHGFEHLNGIWSVDLITKKIKEVKPIKKYRIELQ